MSILLEPLKKSITSLERALAQPLDEFTRDSIIQRFEYTYEIAWKTLRKVLIFEIGLSDIDGVSRRELFRIAAEHSLINDPSLWFSFHEARNLTTHTYNEETADEVVAVAREFLTEAVELLKVMERYRV